MMQEFSMPFFGEKLTRELTKKGLHGLLFFIYEGIHFARANVEQHPNDGMAAQGLNIFIDFDNAEICGGVNVKKKLVELLDLGILQAMHHRPGGGVTVALWHEYVPPIEFDDSDEESEVD